MELNGKKILVTGGAGFLGTFVVNELLARGAASKDITVPRAAEFDLRRWEACKTVVRGNEIVLHLAAKSGGIGLNREKPGELFYDNAIMGIQMIEAARQAGVEKMLALGTICAYPKITPVPFREEDLWNGYPEETNAPFGLAKKMMLVQAQAYNAQYGMDVITLMPINLYGPGDNFDLKSSHVIPAIIHKVADAKKKDAPFIEAWGTGKASRGFLYVEDAAEGIVLALEKYDKPDPVNLGSSMEITIKDLTELICRLMDYRGEIHWDPSKPDGQPRRQLDVSRAEREFGFRAKTSFEAGLRKTIDWYLTRVV